MEWAASLAWPTWPPGGRRCHLYWQVDRVEERVHPPLPMLKTGDEVTEVTAMSPHFNPRSPSPQLPSSPNYVRPYAVQRLLHVAHRGSTDRHAPLQQPHCGQLQPPSTHGRTVAAVGTAATTAVEWRRAGREVPRIVERE